MSNRRAADSAAPPSSAEQPAAEGESVPVGEASEQPESPAADPGLLVQLQSALYTRYGRDLVAFFVFCVTAHCTGC